MAIIINIDVMLAKRKMNVTELADKVGVTMANISVTACCLPSAFGAGERSVG
jgi:DNA-binding Xre family transcriptional regulator